MHWINSQGGRFITLSDELIASWSGYPADGRDPLDTSHDYGRACATNGLADILPVGTGQAIAFGENELGGVWLESSHPILFECVYADSKDSVIIALQNQPDDLEAQAELRFEHYADYLNVFDSAIPGAEVQKQPVCRFPVQPATYLVASAVFKPDDETCLILHRFLLSQTNA